MQHLLLSVVLLGGTSVHAQSPTDGAATPEAVVAEVIYRHGGDDEFFDTPRHAIATGSAIGLLGAAGWEGVEVVLSAMGVPISNALPDSLFDVFLGVVGGAAGAYIADHFLDRLFGRSRTDSNRPRVR